MPAPANDDIGAAGAITPGSPITGTTVEATADAWEQSTYGATVRTAWYAWHNTTGVAQTFTVAAGVTADSPALDDLYVAGFVIASYPADAEALQTLATDIIVFIGPSDVFPSGGTVPDGSWVVLLVYSESGGEGAFGFSPSVEASVVLPDEGRVLIALEAGILEWNAEWDPVDTVVDSLVSGFDIHRGKQTEDDTTDTSTATVYLNDRWGYFDPHNGSSPFAGYLGKQILLRVKNPVTDEWWQQTRMWIDDVDFDINPATADGVSVLSNVQLQCIDIFGLLARIEMDVTEELGARVFGNLPPAGSEGTVFYEDSSTGDGSGFDDRLVQIADDVGLAPDWYVFFSGNIDLLEGIYDVGDSPLLAIQEVLDAEFPALANGFSDKLGRLVAHGRGARFDPDGVWTGIAGSDAARDAVWRFRRWKAGDGAAIALDDERAQIRPPLGWSLSQSKVKNVGYSYPRQKESPPSSGTFIAFPEEDKPGQMFVTPGVDPIERRTWRAEQLLVKAGTTTGNTGAEECLAFATFWATVLADPTTRVSALTFKSIALGHPQAAVTWDLMLAADISDVINLEHGYAGGVGISEDFFVEGSEMSVKPLNPGMDMVTVTFNVSPTSYYADDMGLLG